MVCYTERCYWLVPKLLIWKAFRIWWKNAAQTFLILTSKDLRLLWIAMKLCRGCTVTLLWKGQAISKGALEPGEERWDLVCFTSLQSEGDWEKCPRQHRDPWPGWCHITVLHPLLVSSMDEAMDLHSDKFYNLTPSFVSLIANLKRFAPPLQFHSDKNLDIFKLLDLKLYRSCSLIL